MALPSTGIDLVHVPGFTAQLEDHASAFFEGTFTHGERRDGQSGRRPMAEHLAARYAAKEAFLKAWSGGRWGQTPTLPHVDLKEIEVCTDAYGRPRIVLHGTLAKRIGAFEASVSLSHDKDYAIAVVMLSLLT